MTPDTEPTVVNDEHTRKARSMMDQLRALRDATTDPEVIAEISDEMDCVALSWQIRELFDEEEKTSPQPEPQLIARTHQQRAISSSRHFNSHANCPDMKQPLQLLTFSHAARECAMQMMSNASYIQRELPSIKVPQELRAKVEALCDSLIGTKHDVITELFELEEQERGGVDEERLSKKMDRVVRLLCESIQKMHVLVQEVEQLVSKDHCYGLLFILIIESATNIANSLPGALSDEE